MPRVDAELDAVTDDRRASYLYHTKTAADAVGCHPNKFGDWWDRTEQKLERLARRQPAQLSAHLMRILARVAQESEPRPAPLPRPPPKPSHRGGVAPPVFRNSGPHH